ncbi:hypothetical protein ABT034_32155 [Streptomyces sp. NPDC002773]|uniref:hypothetical protein n=1 Tax=Streptomyces sp. NPDC002773 TaxID=3154430 RepID=UPI00332359E7
MHALRVVADISEALAAACPPGAETRWPALYVNARADDDRCLPQDSAASGSTAKDPNEDQQK